MWRSLVWKEWREQRWRLAFGAALLGTFTLVGLRTRVVPDEELIAMAGVVGGLLFPLMVAMGLVAPERADGTIVRLLALPVRPWQVLAAKGLVGAAVCAGPIVLSGTVAAVVAGDREMSWAQLGGLYATAVGVALSAFGWFTAAGVRQPSEARAGLAGVAVVAGWALAIAVSTIFDLGVAASNRQTEWVAALSPFGLMALKGSRIPAAAVIGIQGLSVAAVWAWAAYRIGKPGKVVA